MADIQIEMVRHQVRESITNSIAIIYNNSVLWDRMVSVENITKLFIEESESILKELSKNENS